MDQIDCLFHELCPHLIRCKKRWFVIEIVRQCVGGNILISFCDQLPKIKKQLLLFTSILKQQFSAGLFISSQHISPRCIVNIQTNMDTVFHTPCDKIIKILQSIQIDFFTISLKLLPCLVKHILGIHNSRIHRHPDKIKSFARNLLDQWFRKAWIPSGRSSPADRVPVIKVCSVPFGKRLVIRFCKSLRFFLGFSGDRIFYNSFIVSRNIVLRGCIANIVRYFFKFRHLVFVIVRCI